MELPARLTVKAGTSAPTFVVVAAVARTVRRAAASAWRLRAASGIASLRYDKRSVGNSDEDYLATGFHDNIADAQAAVDALRSRPEIDPGQIFVIGHSEGAIIASELASDSKLAGVALLAGTAQSGCDLLKWQTAQIASTLPKPVRYQGKEARTEVQASDQDIWWRGRI